MLRTIVSRYVKRGPEVLAFASRRQGKPFLAGVHGASEKVRFNLTGNRWFFTLWTCKEAYLKAIGALPVPGELTARVRLLGDSRPHEGWLIRILSLGPDYAGAIAAKGEDWRVRFRQWPELLP